MTILERRMSYPQVVRVFATTQEPDFDCPWQSRTPSSSTGSGVVIGNGQVLTGAHVVANATFIRVQKASDPAKSVARVKAVCHDCDLALLEVGNPAFLEQIEPAEIGVLPRLRDKVSVVGFPVGGEEISVTEGVVSRIETQRYSHSQRRLLAVTVDAAINRGSSGGPVFMDGKVIGIAFQKMINADNIGEMVPAPIINRFLRGTATNKAPAMPALGASYQTLDNPMLRRRVGLSNGEGGVLITSVEYGGSSHGTLEAGDALLAIDGLPIAINGTVNYLDRVRTNFMVVLGDYFVGDQLELAILRNGERLKVQVELKRLFRLVPRSQYDRVPTYFVYGGLVFQRLTRDFLTTWYDWDKAPKEFLHYYFSGRRTEERIEVVILSQVLADEINVGYEYLHSEGITEVNGHHPLDMNDFVKLVESSNGVVEIKTSQNRIIVMDSKEASVANQRIAERYHIHADRSPDLPRNGA